MANSAGNGVGGGASHPSMVVAWVVVPQSLSVSVVGVFWSSLAKVLPSLVSTVTAVDFLLILEGWFLCVFFVEFADDVR